MLPSFLNKNPLAIYKAIQNFIKKNLALFYKYLNFIPLFTLNVYEKQVTSHKSQVTSHKSQVTSHKSRIGLKKLQYASLLLLSFLVFYSCEKDTVTEKNLENFHPPSARLVNLNHTALQRDLTFQKLKKSFHQMVSSKINTDSKGGFNLNDYKIDYSHAKKIIRSDYQSYTFMLKPKKENLKTPQLLNIVFSINKKGVFWVNGVAYNFTPKQKSKIRTKANLTKKYTYAFFNVFNSDNNIIKNDRELTTYMFKDDDDDGARDGGILPPVTITVPGPDPHHPGSGIPPWLLPDPEDGGGGGGGLPTPPPLYHGPGSGGGTTSPVVDDFTIENLLKNPCLRDIFSALSKGDHNIAGFIANFRGTEDTDPNLILKEDPLFSINYMGTKFENTLAVTTDAQNYNISIIFNTDPNVNYSVMNFSSIIVAAGMIHEIFHAEVYRNLLSLSKTGEVDITPEFVKDHINDFPTIFKYYSDHKNKIDQHEMMAEIEVYRDYMANALADYDNHTESPEFYEALAWIGLKGTDTYSKLDKDIRASIEYEWGQAHKKGKLCDQQK